MDKLPVYTIKIDSSLDSNEGIDFVSLVDYPAIEVNWVAMSKEPNKVYFNQDKQMLYGPILIPNKRIYRNDAKLGEYWVNFPPEVVLELVRKFQQEAKTINLNYQHKKDSQIQNAVIQEIWLTGKVDKSQEFGFDLPIGSAMVGVYIGDSKFWAEEVKTGNVKGFSIEGWLDMQMKSIKKMDTEVKFITATTQDGLVIQSDAESWAQGIDVYTMDGETKKPLEDGDYTLENGTTLKVAGGKVTELVEAALDAEAQEVIQKAIEPILEAMKAEFKKELDERLAALKVEMSNQPAGKKVDKKDDTQPVKMSAISKVKFLTKQLNKK